MVEIITIIALITDIVANVITIIKAIKTKDEDQK